MVGKVGIAQVEITPPVGSSLAGYFYDRKSTGIHDPLYAKTFLFQSGDLLAAVITCDLLALMSETVEEVKWLVKNRLSLPPEHIFVHATHTHTGPATVAAYGVSTDLNYLKNLPQLLLLSVRQALSNLTPARIGFSKGLKSGLSFNRRYLMKDGTVRTNPGAGAAWEKIKGQGNPEIVSPAGPIDPEVVVGKIEDENGILKALLVNFACHLDTVGGNQISADFPSVISKVIHQAKGKDVVVGFFTGAAGNINHINFQTGRLKEGYFAHTEWMGTELGTEVLRVAEKIDCVPLTTVNSAKTILEIPIRKPSASERDFARRVIEAGRRVSQRKREQAHNLFGDEIIWLKELLLVAEEKKEKEEVPVGALRLNEAGFAFLPGEPFVEFGLRIKLESKLKPTFVVELTDSGLGYLPTWEAFHQGTGYEERLSRASKLVPEAGDVITEAVLKLLSSL